MLRRTNRQLNKRLNKIIVRSGATEEFNVVIVGTIDGRNIEVRTNSEKRIFDSYQKYINYLDRIEATHVIVDVFHGENIEGTPIDRVVKS